MKLACVVPWMSPFLWAKPVPAFLNLRYPPEVDYRWFMPSGWCSARRKTAGVEQALEWGADYIWFVDADQLVEPDTLERLWGHVKVGRCPVGALQPARGYFPQFKGSKPFQPLCWDAAGEPFTPTVVGRVIYGPLNCFLIQAAIFQTLRRPWFSERFNVTTMARLSSLDQHFTKKLWDAGTPLWIDPTIRPRHMDAVPLDWSFQDRFDDLMETDDAKVG
jgi:hypothetical protein